MLWIGTCDALNRHLRFTLFILLQILVILISVVVSHYCFNFEFRNDKWGWEAFQMFICRLCFFFTHVSVHILCTILIFNYIILEYYALFVYFGHKLFIRHVFCKYFLPACVSGLLISFTIPAIKQKLKLPTNFFFHGSYYDFGHQLKIMQLFSSAFFWTLYSFVFYI